MTRPRLNGIDHERVLDTHGRLLRDNVYGTIDEDVWRRDFTVNALYYNIADFSLWDYVGGAEDLAAHRLRLIGDPETRYREDPVRMLRAARFEAKLGFTLDRRPPSRSRGCAALLAGVPAARLFDETLKLFLTGHGERSLEVLRQRQLLGELFPAVERYLAHTRAAWSSSCCSRVCATPMRAWPQDKPVTPTFLFALLLYGPIAQAIESLPPQRWHELGAIVEACDRALRAASGARDDSAARGAGRARDVRAAAAAGTAARQARAAAAGAAAFPFRIRSADAARRARAGAAEHRGTGGRSCRRSTRQQRAAHGRRARQARGRAADAQRQPGAGREPRRQAAPAPGGAGDGAARRRPRRRRRRFRGSG